MTRSRTPACTGRPRNRTSTLLTHAIDREAVVAEVWLDIWLMLTGLSQRQLPAIDPTYPVEAGADRP